MIEKAHQREKREREAMTVSELLEAGLVRLAKKARGNPESLTAPRLALGIANKDYPARTPHLWNEAYRKFGFQVRNARLVGRPEDIGRLFEVFREDPIYIGGDVGVGFKDRVLGVLDEVEPLAEAIGSVNVVVKSEKGALKGFNTDGQGFTKSLEEKFRAENESLEGKRVLILGGGATTNAIAFALAQKGASLVILNRTVPKAEKLTEQLNNFFQRKAARFGGRDQILHEAPGVHAIVSAIDDPESPLEKYSALGKIEMPPTSVNIKKNLEDARQVMQKLTKRTIISDVMLRSEPTATLQEARRAGFETLDGIPMVINQGVEAFWLLHSKELRAKNITKEQVAEVMKRAASS